MFFNSNYGFGILIPRPSSLLRHPDEFRVIKHPSSLPSIPSALHLTSPLYNQYPSKHSSLTGLFTPPPSPYAMAGSVPSSTSGALSQQSGSNGCKVGSAACSHPEQYHQPQKCPCRRSINIYCTACRAVCYAHGC